MLRREAVESEEGSGNALVFDPRRSAPWGTVAWLAPSVSSWCMVTRSRGVALLGRSGEIEALGRLLATAREGRSGVLVMVGDPGVGKTAVLEHLVESAPEFRIARAVGVEWEMELPFAAVQQVCAPAG